MQIYVDEMKSFSTMVMFEIWRKKSWGETPLCEILWIGIIKLLKFNMTTWEVKETQKRVKKTNPQKQIVLQINNYKNVIYILEDISI